MNSVKVESGGGYYAWNAGSDHGKKGVLKNAGVKKADTPGLMQARGVSFVFCALQDYGNPVSALAN
ncbi:hypothetical protein [Marinobacter sp.]|uniref:hypothetical protein n=1 Tax=Marinobacter sp. TaxID=50741 RepID=UPI003A8D68D1